MVNIRSSERTKSRGSPKTEVGEIDTRAPFQSVKAAVSLFGNVATSRQKGTPRKSKLSSENILEKETQLMLAQKELSKIKNRLETTEATKSRALSDLQRAKRTVQDLSTKLDTAKKSRQSVIETKEAVKHRSEQLEIKKTGGDSHSQELERARENYLTITMELNAMKQELARSKRNLEAAMEVKVAALQQTMEAQRAAGANSVKVSEVSKEISDMKDAIQQLDFIAAESRQEQEKIAREREAQRESYRAAFEEAEKRLQDLKHEYDDYVTRNLETKLAEKTAEIEAIREEMKRAHASEMDAVKIITYELNESTKTLQELSDEESSLRSLVSSLGTELEDVRREIKELEQKEARKAASEEEKLQDKLREENSKAEQLISQAGNAKREAEEMSRKAQGLKQEAEATRLASEEAVKKLELVPKMVEEAKAVEKKALEVKKFLSEEQSTQDRESAAKIKMSVQVYDSLKGKVEESEKLVEMKTTAVAAQLAEIHSSKEIADKKLEESLKSLREIKAAIDMALKSAASAEAAQRAVEAELQKWRQQD